MGLCLAHSFITAKCFDGIEQMNNYSKWYNTGYLSCTGEWFVSFLLSSVLFRSWSDFFLSFFYAGLFFSHSFDIGITTRAAVWAFEKARDAQDSSKPPTSFSVSSISTATANTLSVTVSSPRNKKEISYKVTTNPNNAGNGSLMRLAAVPLFFSQSLSHAIEFSAEMSMTTHAPTLCLSSFFSSCFQARFSPQPVACRSFLFCRC
jgi:hypothetical protein